MLFSPFAAVNPNFFGGFDAEIVQARPLIEAGAVGIERQSASPRIDIVCSCRFDLKPREM
jgi:hypothetical protein